MVLSNSVHIKLQAIAMGHGIPYLAIIRHVREIDSKKRRIIFWDRLAMGE